VSNELDILRARVDAMAKRVKVLEQSVRPLTALQGVDANLISDQAVVSFAAESIGSTLATVCGVSRTREATAARRQVARLLHERAEWALARVGRNLNRTEDGVRRLLSREI
jgi:hypothetical protein